MKTTRIGYRAFSVCAMALAFLVVSAFALAVQQPADTDDRPRSDSDTVTISACLEKLMLTQQQQAQIEEIVSEYEAEITSVKKEFSERYLQMIRTEVLLLSAIEDNLTEDQRKQVRAQRRKTAQHQKELTNQEVKPGEDTSQPASAVEEGMAVVGISLTAEQQRAADKLQERYLSQLRSLNRDIQGLHMRLVSLEADKLVEIENVLTEDQLPQLRKIRQTIPTERNVQADAGSSTTSK